MVMATRALHDRKGSRKFLGRFARSANRQVTTGPLTATSGPTTTASCGVTSLQDPVGLTENSRASQTIKEDEPQDSCDALRGKLKERQADIDRQIRALEQSKTLIGRLLQAKARPGTRRAHRT